VIKQFECWMAEIQENAIAVKKAAAKTKGDESQWKKEIWKSPEKNQAIKHKFRDEGEKLGYKSRPSYKTGAGEWLYDFIWREFDSDNNLLGIKLAMEIEVSDMNEKGIIYDFNKLLQADSDYKILVFQLKTESDVSNILSKIESLSKKYRAKSNSSVLLCGWSTSLNKFIYKSFEIHAVKSI